MEWIVNAREMKSCDENTSVKYGIPPVVLMERAAIAFTEELLQINKRVTDFLVVCGVGNNGADGLCIARLLFLKGFRVQILVQGESKKKDSLFFKQLEICKSYEIPIITKPADASEKTNCVIDALFGIGLNRNIDGEYKELIEQLNLLSCYKASVDISSGISADTGKILGTAFKADLTVTFAYKKSGQILYPGAEYTGKLVVSDIGINRYSWDEKTPLCFSLEHSDLYDIPARPDNSNKGTFGKVLVIAGSENMAGAAYFSGRAAYLSGAGLVKIYTAEENRIILQERLPEAVMITYKNGRPDEKVLIDAVNSADVVVIGPGIGTDGCAEKILDVVLKSVSVPLIIDADALNIIAKKVQILKRPHTDMLITPHLGEMARLTGDTISYLKEDMIVHAVDFANEYNVTCVMKDARTVTAIPYGKVYINQSGNNGMASAGSGDVLTGIIAGLTAQGMNLDQAGPMGVYIHGLAGDEAAAVVGRDSVMASELLNSINKVMKQREQNEKIQQSKSRY